MCSRCFETLCFTLCSVGASISAVHPSATCSHLTPPHTRPYHSLPITVADFRQERFLLLLRRYFAIIGRYNALNVRLIRNLLSFHNKHTDVYVPMDKIKTNSAGLHTEGWYCTNSCPNLSSNSLP